MTMGTKGCARSRAGIHRAALRDAVLRCVRDARGATSTEYIAVVALVALASSAAFVALGVAVATDFEMARGYLLFPVP